MLTLFILHIKGKGVTMLPRKKHHTEKNKKYVSLSHFIIGIIFTIILTTIIVLGSIYLWHLNTQNQQVAENSDKLTKVYETLAKDYYKSPNKDKLLQNAINGMTKGLNDPYTEFIPKDKSKAFNEDVTGDFVGIGAEMQQKGNQIMITSPMKGSPAEKAGLKPKDVLKAVDGKSIKGKSLNDIIPKIRGEKGTQVTLTIKRGNESKDFTVKRDTIHVKSVEVETKGQVTVFKVNKFQEGTAGELKSAIQKSQKSGAKNIVIDLRNNPGGLLDEAVKMSNIFLDKGKTVLYLEKGKQQEAVKTSGNPLEHVSDLNISILVNEGSASASEIFTGAMKDYKIAKIYGSKTFGKGIVQTTREFDDGSILKFTEMKWLTPHKTFIHGKGIRPDVDIIGAAFEKLTVIPSDQTFKEGDNNKHVTSIKVGLDALGYKIASNDNQYDASLKAAVIQFQKENNLKVTGEFDKQSNQKFTQLLVEKAAKEDPVLDKTIKQIKEQLK
ncbi:PDZ domain-containing protein [Staphylococcus agnetis]|nr:PDZ domain-containing protein [Staphylococcus agnetis]NJI16699.1 PDZ domain-containing protein [Staphylococcus agnetis]PTH37973.1 serine protease [Staphylococcus agnetis]